MKKYISIVVSISCCIFLGLFISNNYNKFQEKLKPVNVHGAVLTKPKNIPAFTLKQEDSNFDDTKLQNKWSMIFFGYTTCPDICPTTLTTLSKAYDIISSSNLSNNLIPSVVFITIDPEHDQNSQTNKYAKHFNKNFIGLSGNKSQLDNLAKSLGVVYQQVNVGTEEESNFIYDHSSTIYVVNPRGQIQAVLTSPHKAENIAKDYSAIVKKYG